MILICLLLLVDLSIFTPGDLNRHLRSIHLQMKPILCPCCNRKFAKQETLLRHLNAAHRGKTTVTIETDASNQTLSSTSGSASSASINVNNNGQTQLSTINIGALASSCSQQQQNATRVTSIQALQATISAPQTVSTTTTTSTACSTINCTTNQVVAESNQTQQSVLA